MSFALANRCITVGCTTKVYSTHTACVRCQRDQQWINAMDIPEFVDVIRQDRESVKVNPEWIRSLGIKFAR